MKKLLLTLVALLALTASVSAQRNTVIQKTEFSWLNYNWGKGSQLKAWIGFGSEPIGTFNAYITPSKQLMFNNQTDKCIQVQIVFSFTYQDGNKVSTSKDYTYESPMLAPGKSWHTKGIPRCISYQIKSMRILNWKYAK